MPKKLSLGGLVSKQDARRRPIQEVTVHRNTVAPTVERVADFFKALKWRVFPYMVFLEESEEGSWVPSQILPVDVVTPHVGNRPTGSLRNRDCIGIAVNHDCRESPLPENALGPLAIALASMVKAGTTFNTILGVPLVPQVRCHDNMVKMCPGKFFDVSQAITMMDLVPKSAILDMEIISTWANND